MDKIAEQFARDLRKKLDSHIKQIILFGSRSRGDYTKIQIMILRLLLIRKIGHWKTQLTR